MKKRITTLAVLCFGLTISSTGFTKSSDYPGYIRLEVIEQQYADAMSSNKEGLIESALFESIKLQIFAPKQKFNELIKNSNKVLENVKSPELRFKAYVVSQFLQHPDWLNNMENINEVWDVSRFKNEGDKLFALLADELQNQYLVWANTDDK